MKRYLIILLFAIIPINIYCMELHLDYETKFQLAVRTNNIKLAQEAINNGVNIHKVDSALQSALHYAAKKGHCKIIDFLLPLGIEISYNNVDSTPICLAHKYNKNNCVDVFKNFTKLLVEQISNINLPAPISKLIALYVCSEPNYELQELNNKLKSAACDCDLVAVKKALKDGADVNTFDFSKNETPLHYAAADGNVELVKLLLQACADKDAKNKYSITPLYFAVRNGHVEVVKLLIKVKANIDTGPRYKTTPLHAAAFNDNVLITRILLDCGAQLTNDEDYDTAFGLAKRYNKTKTLEAFEEHIKEVTTEITTILGYPIKLAEIIANYNFETN